MLKALAWLVAFGSWPEQLKIVLVGWGQHNDVVNMVERAQYLGLPLCWESDATDERLKDLYKHCLFTVYPSLAEGFGLPVAESLAYGKVCICSSNGALAESARDGGCLLVDTSNWILLARSDYLRQLELEAIARPTRTWSMYARELLVQLD